MAKVRPPRKKEALDLAATAVKILKKSDTPLSLKNLLDKINSLPEVKKTISLSNLHNELNFDGRFVFLKGQGWLLKTQVPDLDRDEFENFDLIEDEYQPNKEDYEWDEDEEDDDEDDEDLLVPFDEDLGIDIDDLDDDLDDELDDAIDELEDIDEEVDPLDELEDLEDFEDFESFEDSELEEDDNDPIV